MTATLLARNLRHHGRLILALALGVAAFEVALTYAAAQIESSTGLRTLFQMLPPAFRDAFASQFSLISFASAVAFGFQHPFVLAATVAFVVVVATIPAGECETKLLDLIQARPVPRSRYLLATLVLVILGAAVLPLSTLAGSCVGLALVDLPGELPWTRYISSALGLSTLLLAIGGCTLLISAGAKRRGSAVAQAVGLTLGSFVVEILAEAWPALRYIRWMSPFHYFKPVTAAVIPLTPPENPVVLLAIFAAAAALAFARYQRRDI